MLVLQLIDQHQKGILSQEKLDLVIVALREPPKPKEPPKSSGGDSG